MNPHLGCVRKAPISRKHWGMPYLWESRAGIQEEDAEMSQFLSSLQRKRPAIAGQLVVCKNFFFEFEIYGAFFGCLSWQRSN